jgi:hypothetical protein
VGYAFNPFTGNLDNAGSGGSATPAGSNTQIQFNDSGAFGGDAGLTYNKTTGKLSSTINALAATTLSAHVLENTTAALTGARIQVSPATQWSGRGWKTNSVAGSQSVDYRAYTLPITASVNPIAQWKLQSSVNGAAYSDAIAYQNQSQDGVNIGLFTVTGFQKISGSNSSTIDTLQNLDIVNPSGSRIHLTYTFGSTIRYGITSTDQAQIEYKAGGTGATHNFYVGSSITSQQQILQVYPEGIYVSGNGLHTHKVTAGSGDTTPSATLNTYGSLAVKGTLKLANATLTENETFIYCDATNANICAGTATACSTHTGSGQATCESHALVGCSWVAAVTGSCSDATGTDSGTCTGQGAGCTWEEVSCSGANNTDSSTCEDQDNAYGGNCSWDTSTCPGQTSTAACSAISGCSPDVSGDCSTLSDGGGDGTNCATQSECSYDSGTGACTGSYFVSCSGNLCTGNYATGNCNGTYTITPAACTGTALCGNLTTSGDCTTEGGGCSWVSGMTITLPVSSLANRSNTSRLYSLVNIGATGTVTIVAGAGDTILGYGSGVVLNAQNERVMLHHHIVYGECSLYSGNQATCESTSGCTYNPAVVCSVYDGDESGCNAQSGAGCSYSEGVCSGAGSSASCSGTFTSSKPWVIHQLSN